MPENTARVPTDLSAVATRLAAQSALWSPLIKYDPMSRYYVRLASERTYEAWLLTWVPGQGTDWHDHGGSAGAFVVVQGTLTEESAAVAPGADARVLRDTRRLDVGTLRTFGRKHVHKVTNTDWEPAVSVHVYSPALVEMNSYVRHGDRLRLASSSLVVGVDW